MAVAFYCDLCGKETKTMDLRYINIHGFEKHEKKACATEVECCTVCMLEAKTAIARVGKSNEGGK